MLQITEKEIRKMIAEHLGLKLSDIKLNSRFIDDLGADSLDFIAFIMLFEEKFNITIDDEDVEVLKIKTVSDFIFFIHDKFPTKLELTNSEIKFPITYPVVDVAVVDFEK